ncbi:MAG: AAA family ATPase [Oscillospiraceae bacterium]|nr:AAA family ATPase [Oscillospiraceae bacterium]
MGECVIIYGKSGTGKSRSLKNFADDEIFLVNTINKRLPFPGKFKYTITGANMDTIERGLKTMPCKTAVIDDFGYQQTLRFMEGHGKGDQFKMYNTIADQTFNVIQIIKSLPEDVIVYLIMHEETNDLGDVKLKTIGKLLDQKVCLEGMVTVCLRAMKTGTDRYFFRTQSDGSDISKSPEGMFDLEIENDLKMINDRIREYWGL